MTAPTPWLHIVGMGKTGLDSLMPASRAVVEAAEVIIASARLHDRVPGLAGERINWPSPFDALIETIKTKKDYPLRISLIWRGPLKAQFRPGDHVQQWLWDCRYWPG